MGIQAGMQQRVLYQADNQYVQNLKSVRHHLHNVCRQHVNQLVQVQTMDGQIVTGRILGCDRGLFYLGVQQHGGQRAFSAAVTRPFLPLCCMSCWLLHFCTLNFANSILAEPSSRLRLPGFLLLSSWLLECSEDNYQQNVKYQDSSSGSEQTAYICTTAHRITSSARSSYKPILCITRLLCIDI